MSLLKDLDKLVEENVISQSVADAILNYYDSKKSTGENRLFMVFAIFGAILVGLGIILIIAHNWDKLSRFIKTVFAFLPLLLSQLLVAYTLLKRKGAAWRESAATLLFFSIGASIALISQIYNILGDLSGYLLTWSVLAIPIIYVLNSSMASLLCLITISYYALNTGYWSFPNAEPYFYWLLLLAIIPHYLLCIRQKKAGNFITFHNWLIPLSLVCVLGTFASTNEYLMFVAYMSMFALFYLLAQMPYFKSKSHRNNGYLFFGALGSIVLLMILSFSDVWKDIADQNNPLNEVLTSIEFLIACFFTILAALCLFYLKKEKAGKDTKPFEIFFLIFIPIFVLGNYTDAAGIIINLAILIIGVVTLLRGSKEDNLGLLNLGLLIVATLIVCRFFDTDFSFVVRGLIFLIFGIGFFAANYLTLKRRRSNER